MALLIFAGNAASGAEKKKVVFGPYQAEYITNYDGDTISFVLKTFPNQYMGIQLRLYGIDTPEIKGGCVNSKVLAVKAKDLAREMIVGADKIEVIIWDKDSFGRYIGAVSVDGVDLSAVLLDAQLAKPYLGKAKPVWCDPVQKQSERNA